MNIYLDIASIENDILRRHPEILKCSSFLDRSTSRVFAVVSDTTACEGGQEIVIDRYDDEDYHGLLIQIARWKPKE